LRHWAEHPVDRRKALSMVAASLTSALAACATVPLASARHKLGLADITVMRELLQDYPGTLRRVAALGYTTMGFRLHGYGGGPDPGEPVAEDKARMIRDAGLQVEVVRLGVRNVDYDRELDQIASIGGTIAAMTTSPLFVAPPRIGETTREKFDAWLPDLARIGEKARARGLRLAYHNHPADLTPLGGERPLDLMARQIPPELLSFEVDLAWAWYAGVPPLDLLAQLGPRVASMHWKDVDRTRGTSRDQNAVAPGEGEMNYAALLPRIVHLTHATGYVEVDKPDDGLAAAAAGIRTVRLALAGVA
jgi:sugar phosphate isomerase/epimerase